MIEDVTFRTVELSDPAFEQESLRLATVRSPALGRRADVSFWVPPAQPISTLLILLHGVYGSHWVWSQKASVHRTAQTMLDLGEIGRMVIAMPSDGLNRDGSAYLTWPGAEASEAEDVERWIVEEVPALARMAAPALRPDAKIAIAGLSMGGYGALRLGAKYANRFSGISAHSSITRIEEMQAFVEDPISDYLTCGSAAELSPLHWLETHRDILPPLRFDCGTHDPLIEGNRNLHQALEQRKIPHEYSEFPGGHEWSYWQQHISETLRFVDRSCRVRAAATSAERKSAV